MYARSIPFLDLGIELILVFRRIALAIRLIRSALLFIFHLVRATAAKKVLHLIFRLIMFRKSFIFFFFMLAQAKSNFLIL